jgi:unsaturated rhamnogalacturonyl hydrolase
MYEKTDEVEKLRLVHIRGRPVRNSRTHNTIEYPARTIQALPMNPVPAIVLSALALTACVSNARQARHEALLVGDRVAEWQLAHLDEFSYVRTFRDETEQGSGWIQAAFFIGLAHWAQATDNSRYFAALLDRAAANDWQLGPRGWHADDQAIGQVYLALAEQSESARRTRAIVDAFDRILARPPDNPLEFGPAADGQSEGACQRRWCWCDALFMAPPAWVMLSNATGNAKYRDYAIREYFATTDVLFDADAGLFYRDSRYFGRRSRFGNKVFWSRGNGWVFAGLPLILDALPADHDARAAFVALFRSMAVALRAVQQPAGYWSPSLLDRDPGALPETSGTAFITFGLAWGVNHGLLSKSDYGDSVERGWSAIVAAVDESGRPGWVQQVGSEPDAVHKTDTQLYGSGALLLAAAEMLRWK